MKKSIILLATVAGLACWSTTQATITNVVSSTDDDTALVCTFDWNYEAQQITMTGNQNWGPGHMTGVLTADTPEDPTLIIRNILDNDTSFAWNTYTVGVSLNKTFVLSDALVYNPENWTSIITQPVLDIGSGLYVGQVSFFAGTPVLPTETFDFGYRMVFSGAVQYNFNQELSPIPEPSSLALALLGVSLAIVRRRRPRCL